MWRGVGGTIGYENELIDWQSGKVERAPGVGNVQGAPLTRLGGLLSQTARKRYSSGRGPQRHAHVFRHDMVIFRLPCMIAVIVLFMRWLCPSNRESAEPHYHRGQSKNLDLLLVLSPVRWIRGRSDSRDVFNTNVRSSKANGGWIARTEDTIGGEGHALEV